MAGEAARQNQAVAEILRRRPDLGMRYSDPEAVMRIYASAETPEWQGPIHMQLAALYARGGDRERARSESRAANAWLIRRQTEDQNWKIKADDVGAPRGRFHSISTVPTPPTRSSVAGAPETSRWSRRWPSCVGSRRLFRPTNSGS